MNVRPAPTGYALVVDSTGERHTIGRKFVIGRESAEIAVEDLEASRRRHHPPVGRRRPRALGPEHLPTVIRRKDQIE